MNSNESSFGAPNDYETDFSVFDAEAALQRLLDKDNPLTIEERTQEVLNLELWLMGEKTGQPAAESLAERQQFIEQQWIKQERLLMKERGAHDEEKVLTPRQEKLIDELEVKLKDRVGAGVLLSGPPGTGKSYFLELLAERLADSTNGVSVITAQPMTTSLDLVGTKRISPRELFSTNILNQVDKISAEAADSEKKTELWTLLTAVLDLEVEPYIITDEKRLAAETKKLASMNLEAATSIRDRANFEAVLEANGGINEVLLSLKQHWKQVEQREKMQGLQNIDPGPLYDAGENGYILIVNEVDKMAMNGLSQFGWGLEGLLQTRAGKVEKTGQGISVKVAEGFMVFVSANDLSKIPDNIQRRFIQQHFDSSSQDLIWQARVLLADDEGASVLKDRPQDEHDLGRFLLWWEALGRHQEVAFNTNVLTQLCTQLKQGSSFIDALDTVLEDLQAEFRFFYDQYAERGNKRISYQALANEFPDLPPVPEGNFNLATLNWRANARYLGGETLKQQDVSASPESLLKADQEAKITPQTAVFELGGNVYLGTESLINPISKGVESMPLLQYDFEEDLHLAQYTNLEVAGYSSQGATAVLRHDHGFVVIDMPTGQEIPILNALQKDNQVFGQGNRLLGSHWVNENHGVLILEKQDIVEVMYVEKTFTAQEGSEALIPQLVVRRTEKSAFPGENRDLKLDLSDDVIVISDSSSGKQISYTLNLESTVQPIKILNLPDWVDAVVPGNFGTFVVQDGKAQWLRTS